MIGNFDLTFIVKICSGLMYTEVLSVVKISLEYSKYQILNHSGILSRIGDLQIILGFLSRIGDLNRTDLNLYRFL